MKRYILLKNLPDIEAGEIFFLDNGYYKPERIVRQNDDFYWPSSYSCNKSMVENNKEWFEEIIEDKEERFNELNNSIVNGYEDSSLIEEFCNLSKELIEEKNNKIKDLENKIKFKVDEGLIKDIKNWMECNDPEIIIKWDKSDIYKIIGKLNCLFEELGIEKVIFD